MKRVPPTTWDLHKNRGNLSRTNFLRTMGQYLTAVTPKNGSDWLLLKGMQMPSSGWEQHISEAGLEHLMIERRLSG
jgi:hypothetical protein